jgi:hypothetical protein
MSKFIQSNLYPGSNWTPRLEAGLGSYAFEVYDRPLPIDWGTNIFEWDESIYAGDTQGQSVFKGVTWGNRLNPMRGTTTRWGISGITRDVYGSPIPSCNVFLFTTSTKELVDSDISNPDGSYQLHTPYYGTTHFIVSQKTGTPDIQGVTVNTILPE